MSPGTGCPSKEYIVPELKWLTFSLTILIKRAFRIYKTPLTITFNREGDSLVEEMAPGVAGPPLAQSLQSQSHSALPTLHEDSELDCQVNLQHHQEN